MNYHLLHMYLILTSLHSKRRVRGNKRVGRGLEARASERERERAEKEEREHRGEKGTGPGVGWGGGGERERERERTTEMAQNRKSSGRTLNQEISPISPVLRRTLWRSVRLRPPRHDLDEPLRPSFWQPAYPQIRSWLRGGGGQALRARRL